MRTWEELHRDSPNHPTTWLYSSPCLCLSLSLSISLYLPLAVQSVSSSIYYILLPLQNAPTEHTPHHHTRILSQTQTLLQIQSTKWHCNSYYNRNRCCNSKLQLLRKEPSKGSTRTEQKNHSWEQTAAERLQKNTTTNLVHSCQCLSFFHISIDYFLALLLPIQN